jgi:hypothetical protein
MGDGKRGLFVCLNSSEVVTVIRKKYITPYAELQITVDIQYIAKAAERIRPTCSKGLPLPFLNLLRNCMCSV